MSTFSELTRDDWWLIKNPLLLLIVTVAAIAALLITLNRLDTGASAALRDAGSQLGTARDNLNRIEEEEAAIVANIGRYRELEADAVAQPEDRLQLLERFAQLRDRHSLFPIDVSIEGQNSVTLAYPQSGREPGRPVSLNASSVEFTLPLLHEDDLVRLVNALLEAPGLLQPQQCVLSSRSAPGTNFIYLAQHFSADCSLQWYTLAIQPGTTENP